MLNLAAYDNGGVRTNNKREASFQNVSNEVSHKKASNLKDIHW